MSKDVTITLENGEVYVDTSAGDGGWPVCPECGSFLMYPDIETYEGKVYCNACGQVVSLHIKVVGYAYTPGEKHQEFKENPSE